MRIWSSRNCDSKVFINIWECSEWKWLDVVAWGYVKIETKASQKRDSYGLYLFGFSSQHRRTKIDADIIILVCIDPESEPTYHLFPAKHPVFYRDSGELKKGLAWTPHAKPKPQPGVGISLTD